MQIFKSIKNFFNHKEQQKKIIKQAKLDEFRKNLKPIVQELYQSAITFSVQKKSDIDANLEEINSKLDSLQGIYIWTASCNPYKLAEKWQTRKELYHQISKENHRKMAIVTSKGEPIKFLLPELNPYWNRNKNKSEELILYVGSVKGKLKQRLNFHFKASVQTSALKLNGSSFNEEQIKYNLAQQLIITENHILEGMNLQNIKCRIIPFAKSEKNRFLTYKQIIKEIENPMLI